MSGVPIDKIFKSREFARQITQIADTQPPAILLSDVPHSLKYTPGAGGVKSSVHIGQRKLFDNKVQFFNDIFRKADTANIVYAGAAPSNTVQLLSEMFPGVKWLLVDPNPFAIFEPYEPKAAGFRRAEIKYITGENAADIVAQFEASTAQINIHNDYFTVELARALEPLTTYFISDIRTNTAIEGGVPDSLDVLWNSAQQYNWITLMKPVASMLKFRHPFYAEPPEIFREKSEQTPYKADFDLASELGLDFRANFEQNELVYFAGEIYIQPWAGVNSTESRLITDGKSLHNYGHATEYDDKYFYYNNYYRCWVRHENEHADKKLGFDLCNDCALENQILTDYVSAHGQKIGLTSVRDIVRRLSHITKRPLIRDAHGHFFDENGQHSLKLAAKPRDKHRPSYYHTEHRGNSVIGGSEHGFRAVYLIVLIVALFFSAGYAAVSAARVVGYWLAAKIESAGPWYKWRSLC